MLPEVAALVGPVVGRGVDHAEVRRGRVIEDLRGLFVGERVAVGHPRGLQRLQLVGQAGKAVGRLVAKRVATAGLLHRAVGPEPHTAVDGMGFDGVAVAHEHHLDDRLERGIQQHLDGVADVHGHQSAP